MYTQTAFPFLTLAISNHFQLTGAFPISAQRDPTLPRGNSYITTIAILGSSIVLLFAAKWFYVSRRRRKQRKGTMHSRNFASMWRDDFSASSLHIWEKGSSNKENPVKSAFLVGLFGSPSWETRYSAIIDKVSSSQFQALGQEFAPPIGSLRSKNASERSDTHTSMSSPIFKTKSRVNTIHRANALRPTMLLENVEIPTPLPAMGSDAGKKHFRYSEHRPNSLDYLSWKTNLLSGRHTSYPIGLCIEQRTGSWSSGTKQPVAFLPSVVSGPLMEAPVSPIVSDPGYNAQAQPLYSGCEGTIKEAVYPMDYFALQNSTEFPLKYAVPVIEASASEIENSIIDDSSSPDNQVLFSVHAHPYSQASQHPVTPDMDQGQSTLTYSSGDPEASYIDYRHSTDLSTMLPVKIRPRISPPRETRSRARRASPKVGPSPLRRMFLPLDDPVNESEHNTSSLAVGQEDALDGHNHFYHRSGNVHHSSTSLIQSLNSDKDQVLDTSRRFPKATNSTIGKSSRKQRTTIGKVTTSDNLLDFLDELVQETREWDASLFVDNNFKAMMDHSKSFEAPLSINTGQIKKSTLSRKRRMSFIHLEDIPEVDVTDFSSSDEAGCNQSYWSDQEDFQREVEMAH